LNLIINLKNRRWAEQTLSAGRLPDISNNNENNGRNEADDATDVSDSSKGIWTVWPFSWLTNRPIMRLFLVIFLNGALTNIFSTIFLSIEKPAQDVCFSGYSKECVYALFILGISLT